MGNAINYEAIQRVPPHLADVTTMLTSDNRCHLGDIKCIAFDCHHVAVRNQAVSCTWCHQVAEFRIGLGQTWRFRA